MAPSPYWFLVRETAKQRKCSKSQALYHWLEPVDGEIITNPVGFPVGVPLRRVATRLAQQGVCNGKGKAYHPYQLQEMIFDGLTDVVASLLRFDQLDLFFESERPEINQEQWQVLRDSIEESC